MSNNRELIEALKKAKEFIENLQLPDPEWEDVLNDSVIALANAERLAESGAGMGGWIEIAADSKLTDDMEVGRYMGKKWVITRMEHNCDGWEMMPPNDFFTHYRPLSAPPARRFDLKREASPH